MTPAFGEATMRLRTIVIVLVLTAMTLVTAGGASAESAAQPGLVAIPAGHDSDLKFYTANGGIVTGADALERMPGAGLILWVPAISSLRWTG
jgi:hypothetical protein